MKISKIVMLSAALTLMATSCGGSKTQSASESQLPEDLTVNVDDRINSTYFTGDLSDTISLVPGQYTLKANHDFGYSIETTVKVKVLEQTNTNVSSNSTIRLYDDNLNELAELTIYGGQDALNRALSDGNIDSEFEITFIAFVDDAETINDIFSKAKELEAGESIADKTTSSDDNDSSVADGDFVVRPASVEVSGVLNDIVTIVDQPYAITKDSGLGEVFYCIEPVFEVKNKQKFEKAIEISAELFDENGNKISFDCENWGEEYTVDSFSSFSSGFLQMAIADGKKCKNTSVLIRANYIKNFKPEMLEKIKTFKISSRLIDYEDFDYDNDIYK